MGDKRKRAKRTHGIVLQHAERAVRPRPHEGLVVARQGHRDQAHGDRAGFRCARTVSVDFCQMDIAGLEAREKRREDGGRGVCGAGE